MDTWNEPSSKAAAIERTIRRQYLLRGYEMGHGGERLGPEEAVAFLEEHAQAVEDDIKESTREERHEMRQMILQAGRPDAIEGNMKAIAKKMVQEALPNWRSVRVDNLLTAMRQEPGLWGVRFGGRRGVAFFKQNARSFWTGSLAGPVRPLACARTGKMAPRPFSSRMTRWNGASCLFRTLRKVLPVDQSSDRRLRK